MIFKIFDDDRKNKLTKTDIRFPDGLKINENRISIIINYHQGKNMHNLLIPLRFVKKHGKEESIIEKTSESDMGKASESDIGKAFESSTEKTFETI